MADSSPPILDYYLPTPRPWSWRRLRPTRKQVRVAFLCLLLVGMCYLRWPRIPNSEMLVARSTNLSDGVDIEYRMTKRFEVAVHLTHSTYTSNYASERIATFQSQYDWIRGEHYISLKLTSSSTLDVESDGVLTRRPWPNSESWRVNWSSPSVGTRFGNGIGHRMLSADGPAGMKEVNIYVGTEIPKL
jgi:hypothetical protein